MRANPSPMSVADYCQSLNSGAIVVNNDYQRAEGIWSGQARSFFVESILLEYPIPKLYLHAKLDLLTRQTIKEIVDGQQRSQALRAFFNNKLRLSTKIETDELRGKRYSQIDGEWQTKFLSYSLPIDQFTGATDDDVQEAFRRMNANNVPLNDEEQRNARFQGPFKWFIIQLARDYRGVIGVTSLFLKRDFIRMADIKLYAEMAFVLDEGFRTITSAQLNSIYRKYNGSFENEDFFSIRMRYGLDLFAENSGLRRPIFLRAHVAQSIILALIAQKFEEPYVAGAIAAERGRENEIRRQNVTLETLELALGDPDAYPNLKDFVEACTTRTNVAETRILRFVYFYWVLKGT